MAPSLNPSGNQIGGDVSPVEATAPRNIAPAVKADVAEPVAALKLSGGEWIRKSTPPAADLGLVWSSASSLKAHFFIKLIK